VRGLFGRRTAAHAVHDTSDFWWVGTTDHTSHAQTYVVFLSWPRALPIPEQEQAASTRRSTGLVEEAKGCLEKQRVSAGLSAQAPGQRRNQ
jgi:hypothetical protein